MEILHATNDNFHDLTKEGYVLVDFFATWCGPCKMLGPVLEEIASTRSEVKIVKVDIDEAMDIARSFGIMSVPTMILFKDGKEVSKKTGYMPETLLTKWIEENK